jgi:hypothetical protein
MNGIQFGAQGYLTTDWGDNGHWQTLPVSYLGFAAGAAYAWALEANQSLDLPRALDLYAFRDRAGVMGRIAFELGNTYQATNMILENSTSLFIILLSTLEQAQAHPMIAQATFDQALEAIDRALQPIDQAKMDRPDAGLVLREFDLAGRMLRHACHRGLLAAGKITPEQIDSKRSRLYHDLQDIIVDYTDIWLKRNRPGGLADSTARLEKSKIDYARQP